MKRTSDNIMAGDIFHPGEIVRDELEARAWTQQDLADKMKVSKSEISLVLHGHRGINVKFAVLLEKAMGIDAEFWMNLQVKYDIDKLKHKMQRSVRTANLPGNKKSKLKKLIKAA